MEVVVSQLSFVFSSSRLCVCACSLACLSFLTFLQFLLAFGTQLQRNGIH